MDENLQKKYKVIVVEDEGLIAMELAFRLEKLEYEILASFTSGEDLIKDIDSLSGDVILMDVNLAGETDGISAAKEVRKKKDIPIIFLTAFIDDDTFQRAKLTDPAAYLTKPFAEAELYKTIELAIYGHGMKRKLKESEDNLNLIFKNVSEFLILWDINDGNAVCAKCNISADEHSKKFASFAPGQSLNDFQLLDDSLFTKEHFSAVMEKLTPLKYEVIREDGENQEYYAVQINPIIEFGNKVTHILCIIKDISERKKSEKERRILESQLRQSQKLEAIGSLASGMAHEINNPLMGVINYSQLIRDKMEKESQLWKYASAIMEEGHRISTIVQNLLSFAHRKNDAKKPEEAKDIINSALKLTAQLFKKSNIQFKVTIPDDLPKAVCRIQEIHQVLLNLFNNARFALNEKYPQPNPNKILSIEAKLITEKNLQPLLRIQVEDYGTGIKPDVMEKIFDPFFTTKPRSEGTGLGLSVSYGIIRDHDGRFLVESEDGNFTRFMIDLPTDPGEIRVDLKVSN